jgi:predicted transposase YdaD
MHDNQTLSALTRRAIAELLALPSDHLMKRRTMEHLAVLQISLNVGQNLSMDERALAMNLTPIYEKWRQETLNEGQQRGLEQGLEQGLQHERSLILRLLSCKVGTIAPTTETQIRTLSLTQLETLGEALLDFSQPSDLTDWLRNLGT